MSTQTNTRRIEVLEAVVAEHTAWIATQTGRNEANWKTQFSLNKRLETHMTEVEKALNAAATDVAVMKGKIGVWAAIITLAVGIVAPVVTSLILKTLQ